MLPGGLLMFRHRLLATTAVTALAALGLAPLLDRGIDGRGETIVMPEFVSTASTAGVTDVRADLARFDSLFGLPPANLQVETDIITTYTQALRFAASLGSVISVTAGYGEACFTSAQVTAVNAALQADEQRQVTVIASSGDSPDAQVLVPLLARPQY
jgi:hypothetical protein